MAEKTPTAPPLTVDSVLAAVQGVKWRTVGEMLLVFAYKVDKIGQQYKSDDDRLHAVVTTWLQGDRKDVEPSWRLIIWRLDHANQTKAADKIRDFAEPVLDPTLTVENVIEVIGKMRQRIDQGDALFRHGLRLPDSKLQVIKQQFSSRRDNLAVVQYWVNTAPDASWERIASILYQYEEERALTLAKKYLPKDHTLTSDRVMEVVKELEHKWDDLGRRLGVVKLKVQKIASLHQSDHQKMEAIIDHYVRYHPTASWKKIALVLEAMKLHTQAVEVTEKYVKGSPKPSQVERYSDLEFMEKVGAGGFGAVSRGRWIPADKIVAIKTSMEFDEREVLILSSLDHPSIIQFYGTVKEKNFHFIITEFAENGSIYDYIHVEHKEPSLAQRLLWAKEVVEGMIYLHSRDIIHRDLKSSNVLLTSELKAKICDLGSARTLEHTAKQTTATGTYAWMAPEMMKGDPVSKLCDIYSYGIFLWELVTQQQPFPDVRPQFLVMYKVLEGTRPPIPETCESYLEQLLTRCWQTEAKARPSFEEILMILNKDTPPSDATSQPTPPSDATSQPPPKIPRSLSRLFDVTTDTKPRIAHLMKLKTTGGDKVEIIKTLAPDWKEIGFIMDLDPNGQTVERIEAEHAHNGPVTCCREIFRAWLDSPSATWGNLIELLMDSEQEELAEQLKDTLSL